MFIAKRTDTGDWWGANTPPEYRWRNSKNKMGWGKNFKTFKTIAHLKNSLGLYNPEWCVKKMNFKITIHKVEPGEVIEVICQH